MSIVCVVGEKGGTGKSIISTNLAAMLAMAGKDVLLIDTDPMGSSSGWQATRAEKAELATVHCISKFGKTVTTEARNLATRYDEIIIDAGGRDSVEMRAALLAADLAILPFQPAQFDLWTVAKMHELLEQCSAFNTVLRALAVVNLSDTNACSTDHMEAQSLISEFEGLELLDKPIKKRVAFKRASAEGMGVAEYLSDPTDKAVQEIQRLYRAVYPQ